jgi:hypothetical protein
LSLVETVGAGPTGRGNPARPGLPITYAKTATNANPRNPNTNSTTSQVLLGRSAVFTIAPIQAMKIATAAADINKTANSATATNTDAMAPDWIPTTSGPSMINTSVPNASAAATPHRARS